MSGCRFCGGTKESRYQFCSEDCRLQHRRARQKAFYHRNKSARDAQNLECRRRRVAAKPLPRKECVECGAAFEIQDKKKFHQQYCNPKCRRRRQNRLYLEKKSRKV